MITIDEVTQLMLDVEENYQCNMFLYIAPKLSGYNLILGLPWLKQQCADIILFSPESMLVFKETGIKVLSEHRRVQSLSTQISAAAFSMWAGLWKQKKNIEIFAASMADIEKALRVRKHMNLKTKLSAHYHAHLDTFDQNAADVLPSLRSEVDH